ncbi:MAG: hypothetical protein V7K27_21575 [Nostoc sp.]
MYLLIAITRLTTNCAGSGKRSHAAGLSLVFLFGFGISDRT